MSGKQQQGQHSHKATGKAGAGPIKCVLNKPKPRSQVVLRNKNSVHSLRECPPHSKDTGKGWMGTGDTAQHSVPVQHCTKQSRDDPQPQGGEHRPGATAERQHFTSAFCSPISLPKWVLAKLKLHYSRFFPMKWKKKKIFLLG